MTTKNEAPAAGDRDELYEYLKGMLAPNFPGSPNAADTLAGHIARKVTERYILAPIVVDPARRGVIHMLAEGRVRHRHLHGGDWYRAMADTILEAGYRKPRIIETVEELDKLPTFSVIRVQQGETLERLSDGWYAGALEDKFTAFPIWLPATVLWEPEAEVGA